jgi:hypothetical protein
MEVRDGLNGELVTRWKVPGGGTIEQLHWDASGKRVMVITANDGLGRHVVLLITTFAFVVVVLSGMRVRVLSNKSAPNQGIWLTLRAGGVIGLVTSLLAGFVIGVGLQVSRGELVAVSSLADSGKLLGAAAYGAGFGIPMALLFGGGDVIRHVSLRLVLALFGDTPWKYARFLDEAARRGLLRRVGGSYIFLHPLLMQYLARKAK